MGIRGDMEAPFWGELGKVKSREIAVHCFECLKDPNAWARMKRELLWSDEQLSTYLEGIDWLEANILTRKP